MIDHKKPNRHANAVYAKKGRTYLDNPSRGGSAQHREQSNSLTEVKAGDAGGKRTPQSEYLRRERYLSFPRSTAVSRNGSGTEPMIRGVVSFGVMRAYAGSEVAERVHASRVDIGSVRRGSCSVQEKRTLGTSRKLRGKIMRSEEKDWMERYGSVEMEMELELEMEMEKEGHGSRIGRGTVRYGSTELWLR
jgi:hypothetical protein